ncbi:MAG: CapA family protein [bacterium]
MNRDDSTKNPISILAVGDLMMGGRALTILEERGPDYPFDSTRTILQQADISIANLEAPFTTRGVAFDKQYTFRVPPEYAIGVKRAGFDVLTLANNHVLDYGPEGLFSTSDILDSLSIAHCGAGRDAKEAERGVVLERGGWRVGFLAYSMTYPSEFWDGSERCGTAYPHQGRMEAHIRSLKDSVDLVVVSFHWGGDLHVHPRPYQREYAHIAVDCGADLVVGHHPHVLQGLEMYQGRLIAYSLGNFVFGSYNRNAKESAMLKVRFDSLGFLMAEVIPINVYNDDVAFQPRLLKGVKKQKVVQNLNTISMDLNAGKLILNDSGFIVLE